MDLFPVLTEGRPMHPDTVLIIVVVAAAVAALPTLAWARALRRIRDLEMALMAQATDEEALADIHRQLAQIAAQSEHLLDQQSLLAARLGDRRSALPPAPPQAITPH